MPAPVSVCLIVRDEEATLERCLQSIRPHVQEIVVVDTGSVDSTPEIARRYADIFEVYIGCNDSSGRIESFSRARNKSLSLATLDWVVWFDGDDEVRDADKIQSLVDQFGPATAMGPVSIMLPYEYGHDHRGNPVCVHYRERLVYPRSAFEWRKDVHELLCDKNGCRQIQSDLITVVHRRDFSKKRQEPGRNLRILKATYDREGDSDPRTLYYLGKEYADTGDLESAITHLSTYIDISGWDDEKYLACLRIAECHRGLGRIEKAIDWALKATSIQERWGEAYFELARCHYFMACKPGSSQRRHWERCVHFARLGLSMPETKTTLFVNPLERNVEVHRYLNVALNALGDVEGALESTETALKTAPDESQLLSNARFYREHLARRKFTAALADAVDAGVVGEVSAARAREAFEGAPLEVGDRQCAPVVPERELPSSPPSHPSQGALLAMLQSLWKSLILHDDIIRASSLLDSAPWQIRELPEVLEMRRKTDAILAPHRDESAFQEHYVHTGDWMVSEVIPMPQGVPWHHSHFPRWKYLLDTLEERSRAVGRKLNVLDVGCMDGWASNRMAAIGHKVWGVDTSPSAIELASRKATEFNTGANFVRCGFDPMSEWHDSLPYRFDIIVLFEVYEHVHDTESIIRHAADHLVPGGVLVLSTPRGSWSMGYSRPGHHSWNAESFREHIRAVVPSDVRSDFESSGLEGFSYEIREFGDRFIPGQSSLLCRGSLPDPKASVEHVRTPLDISFYVGGGCERWNPETAKKSGIGGSETAVIEMARGLVSLGNRVRVYGDCSGVEGSFDGVEYLDHPKFRNSSSDFMITSRRPEAVDFGTSFKASACWVHDIHCGDYLTHERALRLDRFFCLSGWHRDFFLSKYDFVHPSQVRRTRNGINPSRFSSAVPRDPHRAVYSSSPDRGLEAALMAWPLVRSKVPDAELHVYYGFQTWESFADGPGRDQITRLKRMLRDGERHGVIFHGRVNQEELAREYLASGVWAYPTWFHETSCISAMEAHAAGLRMVTSPIGALQETVGPRGSMVSGEWMSDGFLNSFANEVTRAMLDEDEAYRGVLQAHARDHMSWDGVVREWDSDLRVILKEVQHDIVTLYKRAV